MNKNSECEQASREREREREREIPERECEVWINGTRRHQIESTRDSSEQSVGDGLRDLPLLFVYFQVNTGVLCFLDYVEDIYIMVLSVLVSTLNLNHMYLPLLNGHGR